MKIVCAGGTGFIGKSLLEQLLKSQHQVTLLTRQPKGVKVGGSGHLETLAWDGETLGDWTGALDGADAVINLCGDSVAEGRWTATKKKRIVSSRIESTRVLVAALKKAKKKPSVLLNASAVGYYGNVPEGEVDEKAALGSGFLAEVCDDWEQQANAAQALGVRTVLLRIGVVLEQGGGALGKMVFPFKIFAGGHLGSGRQWFPWIHRDDIIGAIFHCLNKSTVTGPVNLTAPEPVTMKDFCQTLGRVLSRPSWAPVPGFVLKIGLGEMATMLLEGQKAVPKKLQDTGYQFQYRQLQPALKAILSS